MLQRNNEKKTSKNGKLLGKKNFLEFKIFSTSSCRKNVSREMLRMNNQKFLFFEKTKKKAFLI